MAGVFYGWNGQTVTAACGRRSGMAAANGAFSPRCVRAWRGALHTGVPKTILDDATTRRLQ